MNKLTLILICLIAVFAHVAWSGFLVFGGVPFPLIVIFGWGVLQRLGFEAGITYVFFTGLLLDLLGSNLFGINSLALLLAAGSYLITSNFLGTKSSFGRFISLILMVVVFEIVRRFF